MLTPEQVRAIWPGATDEQVRANLGATEAQLRAMVDRPGGGGAQTEPGTGKQYVTRLGGKKYYVPPQGGPDDKSGGGWVHGRQVWNADTGEYESHLDMSKIMTYVAAGLITAGTADIIMSSAAAPAALSSTTAAPSAASTIPAATYGPGGVVTNFAGVAPMAAHASSIPWGTIIGAGTQLFGNLFAAHEQTSAADRAAQIQADAAKYSADLMAKANADALAFQRGQAENAFQNNEASRRGNYQTDAARQRRLGFIGEEVGLGPREIPAYVPGVDPNLTGTASASMTGTPDATGGADPQIASFIANWQQSHAPTEGIAPLADAIAKQFPGVSRFMYGQTPSNNELSIGGQKYKVLGGEGGPGAYWYQPGTNDMGGGGSALTARPVARAAPLTTATPFMPATIRPGVQIPQSIGYYA